MQVLWGGKGDTESSHDVQAWGQSSLPPTLSQLTQSHSTLGAGRQLVTHTSDSDWDISTWFCQPAQSTVIYVRSGIAAYVGFANIAIAAWNWIPSYLWPSLNFRKFTFWICFFEWIHHTIEIIWVGAPWLSFACFSDLGKQGCCFNWVQVIIFIFLPPREATHILDSLILAEYCRRVFLPF